MNTKEFENKLVSKINELYITNRQSYLVMRKFITKEDGKIIETGKYSNYHKAQDNFKPLNDSHIKSHLRGKYTIGVFSGDYLSKFLCFDLDILDKSKLKWTYHLLFETLIEIGIPSNHIHVASSGNKGLHVNLFIENGTKLTNLITLFLYTMSKIEEKLSNDVHFAIHKGEGYYAEFDFGKIEFRPTSSQGVKIELGKNYFNPNNDTNKCDFLDNETLEKLGNTYILDIEPISKNEFINIMDTINDIDYVQENEIHNEITEIKSALQESSSMKINKDEPETIESIKNLLINGLYMEGTRHNSSLKIAKYFRYMGLELDDCIKQLQEWMKRQNKKYYSSSLEFSLTECDRISRIVYEKEYSLFGNVQNIQIYKSEVSKILEIKNKNDKLLLYSMLIHSKRYSTINGIFFMTYAQMEEMCGLKINGAMATLQRLEESGYVEVVSRNIRRENGAYRKPNKYKLLLNVEEDEVVLEIDNSSLTFNDNELYYKSLINTYTNKELKKILPDKQYREVYNYRKLIAI